MIFITHLEAFFCLNVINNIYFRHSHFNNILLVVVIKAQHAWVGYEYREMLTPTQTALHRDPFKLDIYGQAHVGVSWHKKGSVCFTVMLCSRSSPRWTLHVTVCLRNCEHEGKPLFQILIRLKPHVNTNHCSYDTARLWPVWLNVYALAWKRATGWRQQSAATSDSHSEAGPWGRMNVQLC